MIHVRIKTSFEDADFERQQFDVGIFNGPLADDHLYACELFSIDMFPVCSPALISVDTPLDQPVDLEHYLQLQIPSIKNEPASWIQVTKHKPEPGSAVYLFTEWLRREIDTDSNFMAGGSLTFLCVISDLYS